MNALNLLPAITNPSISNVQAKPIVKWAGGKTRLLKQLLPLVPADFKTYYEPFLGGGALFFALTLDKAVIGDWEKELMLMYQAVRREPDAVMEELDRLQSLVEQPLGHALEDYKKIRSAWPEKLPSTERAARLIYLNKTCYNGLYRVNKAGQFNVPMGKFAKPPKLYDPDTLLAVSRKLRLAEIRCGDFAETLESAGPGDFAYLDPPYVPLSPTASFTAYTSEGFGEQEHRRLAETVRELTDRGCRVLQTNSDTPLVRELYAGYEIDTVYASRNINSKTSGRGKITELAIRNYKLA